jgi:hypothetical protein
MNHAVCANVDPHSEDLEAQIPAPTREFLDAAGQDCARSGHVWKAPKRTPLTADPPRIDRSVWLKLTGFEG